MSNNERNISILKKIISYCNQIEEVSNDYGCLYDVLKAKSGYKNATAMCILQIGELTSHLSDDFRNTYSHMPWQQIRGMRNLAAHQYGSFDTEKLWETITEDIPVLRDYCVKIVNQHELTIKSSVDIPEKKGKNLALDKDESFDIEI